jgi:hypothetical protein
MDGFTWMPQTQTFLCYMQSFFSLFVEETEGRHASAKAQDAIDHMASFSSCREEISNPQIEPPTSSLGFGYLSTIIR